MSPFNTLLILCTTAALAAARLCPLLGPDLPAPRNLSQSPAFQSTLKSFAGAIQQLLSKSNNSTFDSTKNAFSINIFSMSSDAPLYEHHHTPPLFSNGSIGTTNIDGNTVYRIGSISKLVTVFAFLIEKGDLNFNDPVTKYVPELKAASFNPATDVLEAVQWDFVTIGSLASHMSGIGRDFNGEGELAFLGPVLLQQGFPPLPPSELPTCGISIPGIPVCDRAAFFKGFLARHPVYAPSTTPIYSNIAFQLLAYALENMACDDDNKTFESLLYRDIFKPLSMARTSTSAPPNSSIGAIPNINIQKTGWYDDLGYATPGGGMYSTSNDVAKMGRAILNSTLLPHAQTRRWMKPVTHTSSLALSVGAPWEIFRVPIPGSSSSSPRAPVDFYAKSGGIGVYSSQLVLIPDFDVGYVILSAANTFRTASVGLGAIEALIVKMLIPAIEAAARAEAKAVFAGTYRAAGGGLNSSIVIVTDDGLPGLGVRSLVSNGTDVFQAYLDYSGVDGQTNVLIARLYPTNLVKRYHDSNRKKKQAFRAVVEIEKKTTTTTSGDDDSLLSSICFAWAGVDGGSYGNVAVDEVLFEFDEFGRAVSVEPKAYRVALKKVV